MKKYLTAEFMLPYLFTVVFWFVVLFIFCNTSNAAEIDQMVYASLVEVKKTGVNINSLWLVSSGICLWKVMA